MSMHCMNDHHIANMHDKWQCINYSSLITRSTRSISLFSSSISSLVSLLASSLYPYSIVHSSSSFSSASSVLSISKRSSIGMGVLSCLCIRVWTRTGHWKVMHCKWTITIIINHYCLHTVYTLSTHCLYTIYVVLVCLTIYHVYIAYLSMSRHSFCIIHFLLFISYYSSTINHQPLFILYYPFRLLVYLCECGCTTIQASPIHTHVYHQFANWHGHVKLHTSITQ